MGRLMMQSLGRWRFTVVALFAAFMPQARLPAVETIPAAKVVVPFMGEGLELAVIPTPQEDKLSDRMLVLPRLEIEAPAKYAHPATIKDATRWAATLTPGGTGPATRVLLGELGDG